MSQFDKDIYLECLPINTYNELVRALNKDSNWILLANHVAEQLEYPSNSWIQSLKESCRTSVRETPADRLLFELNVKMCTVEILITLLEDCRLFNVLSILSLPEPLRIVEHPIHGSEDSTVKISFGQCLKLSCKATGMPPPSYVWYHENRPLQHFTSSELYFVINRATEAGEYKCKVSQIKNDGTLLSVLVSRSVFVQIYPTPVVIETQPLALLEVKEGESFTISCKANSYPEPRYQWFHDNTKLEGQTSNTLCVKRFSLKDEGKYYCYILNDVSEAYTQRSHVMMDLPKLKAVAKIALIIANGEYECHECLPTPKADAGRIANLLKEIGFKVICLMNLTITQMKNAMKVFSEALSEGIYGLFYFAGHGFKMQESYMLAVDAPKTYLRKDAICESELLAMFLEKDPELLVVILDMCQTVPSKEFNPDIHNEVPMMNEYKSRKNLRNLIQAYSTSSHRPSYERTNSKYGLYMMHLSKYINKDLPVTKVFEEVGKSVDAWFKGKERNQIPMFALTITKPFRLTDALHKKNPPPSINSLSKITSFPTRTLDICFKQAKTNAKVIVSQFMEPYLNLVKVKVLELDNVEVNFFNSVPTKRNNLYQDPDKMECWIHNPQINEGPLVISVSKNGVPIGATLFHVKDYIPSLLKYIDL